MITYLFQWLRSLIFVVQMYVAMVIFALVFMIPALMTRKAAIFGMRCYCMWVIWTARWMINLKVEVRGMPPTTPVLIAAKHQSFFDIIILMRTLPEPRFIVKRILFYTPILGQYAIRIGCIFVDRRRPVYAMRKLLADIQQKIHKNGQLVIYPQGTRVAPGASMVAYKTGVGMVYRNLECDCVPVATNLGIYWPKRSIYRRPGTAIVQFMEPIPTGLEIKPFMTIIEGQIEMQSNALMVEAGFSAMDTAVDTVHFPKTGI